MNLSTLQLLALKSLPGVGPQSILKLINASSSDLISAIKACNIKVRDKETNSKSEITPAILASAIERASAILERNAEMGIQAISYFDPLFPEALRRTMDEAGKKPDPPFIIFYKGDISILKMPCLAVIGTRDPLPMARKAGKYIAGAFAREGFCIVSGLATGCDTVAHEGALEAGGRTLAFMGHGLDMVYPPQNANLARAIVNGGGLLMSEYPAATKLSRFGLVARDRLQAGISLATIVIQTGESGGTMHAANATLNSGKPLYVLEYSDVETEEHERNRGNHLLKDKGAKAIRGGDDPARIADAILGASNGEPAETQGDLLGVQGRKRCLIFDLDQTLVETSMLDPLRKARDWQTAYKRMAETRLYEGIAEVFDHIRKQGLKVAIVSSSPRPYVERLIRTHDIPCDHIIAYHDTKRHKPDPDPLLRALELLGAKPENAISFGDRAMDITASNAAGIPAIACMWGSSEADAMKRCKPAHCLYAPREMLKLIRF